MAFVIGLACFGLTVLVACVHSPSPREVALRELLDYTGTVFKVPAPVFNPMSAEAMNWQTRIDSLSANDVQLLCQMFPSLTKKDKRNALAILALTRTQQSCRLATFEVAAADQDSHVRSSAASVLGMFAVEPRVLALFAKLLSDPDAYVREIAGVSLEDLSQKSPEAKVLLEKHKGKAGGE